MKVGFWISFFLVLFQTQLCVAQVKFEDIKAAYLENKVSLELGGIHIRNFYQYEELKDWEQCISNPGLLIDPTRKPVFEVKWGRAFDIYYDDSGFLVRKKINVVQGGGSGTKFPSNTLPFDLDFGQYESYYKKNSEDIVTTSAFKIDPVVKTYSKSRMTLKEFVGATPGYHHQFYNMDVNSPFLFKFDNNPDVFMPFEWVLYFWNPKGIQRSIEKLEDNYRLILKGPTEFDHIFPGIKVGQTIVADVSPKQGYLPINLGIYQTREIDGTRFPWTTFPKNFIVTFNNEHLEGRGYYCKRAVMEHRIDASRMKEVIASNQSKEAYVHFTTNIDTSAPLTTYARRLVETQAIEPWASTPSSFSPAISEDVRVVDHTTGEVKLTDKSKNQLVLDLERGEEPLMPELITEKRLFDTRTATTFFGIVLIAFGVLGFKLFRSRTK